MEKMHHRSAATGGFPRHPQLLADQLTLIQPGKGKLCDALFRNHFGCMFNFDTDLQEVFMKFKILK